MARKASVVAGSAPMTTRRRKTPKLKRRKVVRAASHPRSSAANPQKQLQAPVMLALLDGLRPEWLCRGAKSRHRFRQLRGRERTAFRSGGGS